jgi:hypothetical protein
MQKQVNPVKEDLRVEEPSIRVMCKGMITLLAAVKYLLPKSLIRFLKLAE